MSQPRHSKLSEFNCMQEILQSITEFTDDLDNFVNGERKPDFTEITNNEKIILGGDLDVIEDKVREISDLFGW